MQVQDWKMEGLGLVRAPFVFLPADFVFDRNHTKLEFQMLAVRAVRTCPF